MKNLKRLMALMLAVCLMLCLCACADGGDDLNPDATSESTENTDNTQNTEGTDATEDTDESAEPTYTVTVVDEDNNPVVGAWVQLCLESCVPAATNDSGVAEFFLEEDDYKVSFMVMPEGYDYTTEEQEWHFADGENSMTIVLKAVA